MSSTMQVSGAVPVAPRSFVKLDPSGKQVAPTGAGDAVFGISGQTAAQPGQYVELSTGDFELCSIIVDSSIDPKTPIRKGQPLKSGPNGGALPADFSRESIGAIATEDMDAPAAGKKITCRFLSVRAPAPVPVPKTEA